MNNEQGRPMKVCKGTVFFCGEPADSDDGFIQNRSSAWQDDWVKFHGGVDSPDKPFYGAKENPFYCSLNIDDLNNEGDPKSWNPGEPEVWKEILAETHRLTEVAGSPQSALKNAWWKFTNVANGKVAYAQQEDVGPYQNDGPKAGSDVAFVFGDAPHPINKLQLKAGCDLSPALAQYLEIDGDGEVYFEYMGRDEAAIPDGPWKKVITRSQCSWDES